MKKFINTASMLTFLVIALLDCGVAFFFIFAMKEIIKGERTGVAALFTVMMLFALFIAIKVTLDQCKTGVEFHTTQCIFNNLDSDNSFPYSEIKKVETEKDEKVSFIKNFIDRSALLKITTKNGRVHIINLGTLSRRRLERLRRQIELRIGTTKTD